MTSLLDIGPLSEEVLVNGKSVTVRGVTPEGFFYVLAKFPELQAAFSRGGEKSIDMVTLQAVAPRSVAFALAVATTDRTEFDTAAAWQETVEKAAVVAVQLSAHHQMALFQTALRLTFPEGVGPFMKGVEALANSIKQVSGTTADQATTSSRPSRSGFKTDSPGLRLGKLAQSASSAH